LNPDSVQIEPASLGQAAEAMWLVFGRLAREERYRQVDAMLASVAEDESTLAGLLEARRGGKRAGAVFAQVQPGKTALVWTPSLVEGEPLATASRLLEAVSAFLVDRDVQMAYVLMETVSEADDTLLRAGGYESLSELLYMVSSAEDFPAERPPMSLTFESYNDANHARLSRVVEATYEQTLDCPRLNGVRLMEDVLAGYRATGMFDPARWMIVRHDDNDIGCLLLADHAKQENWELVYMGVAASCRGHRWGREIVRHAQWLVGRAGRPRLVLAVDAKNAPAIRMYQSVGFQSCQRRSVYLRLFD